jgi:hypothetical protein
MLHYVHPYNFLKKKFLKKGPNMSFVLIKACSRGYNQNICIIFGWLSSWACFTLGVRANGQPKSSIPIGAKVEISPKGFTLKIKANIEIINSIYP